MCILDTLDLYIYVFVFCWLFCCFLEFFCLGCILYADLRWFHSSLCFPSVRKTLRRMWLNFCPKIFPFSVCYLRDCLNLKRNVPVSYCLPESNRGLEGCWEITFMSLSHRSGSAQRMLLANSESTSARCRATSWPSERERAASTPGATAAKTRTATVETLITGTAGPKGKIKDSSWGTLMCKVSVTWSLGLWGREQGEMDSRAFSYQCALAFTFVSHEDVQNW